MAISGERGASVRALIGGDGVCVEESEEWPRVLHTCYT